MMRAARKELNLDANHTIMIGDTMDTDILGGMQMGYPTVLVLSGNTQRPDLANYAFRPDVICESLGHTTPQKLIQACSLASEMHAPHRRELMLVNN
jgi:NagD protein